jgi:hypothetical protein
MSVSLVNGSHLSRKHRLDLIFRLDVFDDGKHEGLFIAFAVLRRASAPLHRKMKKRNPRSSCADSGECGQ